jgi:hypothetical protein
MRGDTFITFRGIADCCLVYDVDFSGPGSGCGVEWCFSDQDVYDALGEKPITPEEEEAIIRTCIEAAEDRLLTADD